MRRVFRVPVLMVWSFSVAVLPAIAEPAFDHLKAISDAQAALYEKVAPSVVRIRTGRSHPDVGGAEESPFRYYFEIPKGREFGPFDEWFKLIPDHPGRGGESKPRKAPEFYAFGIASGIIVRSDEKGAWILTNNHVLEGADQVVIEFHDELPIMDLELDHDPDSEDRNAFLDRKSDLAMIYLSPEVVGERKLVPAAFGDSDQLRVGDVVFTLGAPLNREWSFGQGIVSGKGRDQVLPRQAVAPDQRELRYEGFIQTTAFINVGNSGGPLIDIDGNVVGINVAIQTAGGFSNGFIGIGFAIPSNRAKRIVDQIIEHGKVVRGWLGVSIGPPDPNDTEYYHLEPHTGVKVMEVFEDTPAKEGGIRVNDIIITFNGTKVTTPSHLQELVAQAPVNQKAKIEVLRAGKKVELEVPVGIQPDEPALVARAGKWNFPELGAVLRDMKPEEVEYYKEKGNYRGVVVEEVDEEGPLWNGDTKIKKGSLITAIEDHPVTSVKDTREFIDQLRKEAGTRKEKLVMIKYVSAGSSGDIEEFQVIKLRFEAD